ncbi:mechanosensitive ion channel family protein [Marinomonas epiphytica]
MIKVVLVILLVVGYFLLAKILASSIASLSQKKSVKDVRASYVAKMLNLGLTALFVLLICLVLGVGYGELAIFFSSVFAVVGVALFAQWSILSNITASLLIFFSFPYKVGDWVKVVDKDDEIIGQIIEISTFHVIIRRLSEDVVTYPNNLILQKPVIRLQGKEAAQAFSQFKEKAEAPQPENNKS